MGRFAFFTTSSSTWSGSSNTPVLAAVTVSQAFIYNSTLPALGGRITRALEHASLTSTLAGTVTLDSPLSFSAQFSVSSQDTGGVYFGWMNGAADTNTQNFLGVFIKAESNTHVFVRPVVWTSTGPGSQDTNQIDITTSVLSTNHTMSLVYDPTGASSAGTMVLTVNGVSTTKTLISTFRGIGASMDRFGLENIYWWAGSSLVAYITSASFSRSGGTTVVSLSSNPGWISSGSNTTYSTTGIEGNQSFGFVAASYANNTTASIGGTFFRHAPTSSKIYWADALSETLTLDDRMQFYGKVSFQRQNVDSGTFIAFFNESTIQGGDPTKDGPSNVLGVYIEGNTTVGHRFSPMYINSVSSSGRTQQVSIPSTKQKYGFRLLYDPLASSAGQITLEFLGQTQILNVATAHRSAGASFTHFGIFPNADAGGGPMEIYFACDDYTHQD